MNRPTIILIVLLSVLTTSCAYQGVKESSLSECNYMSEPERSYCIEDRSEYYESYERTQTTF